MRGLLVSILFSGLILGVLVTISLNSISKQVKVAKTGSSETNSGSNQSPIEQAKSVRVTTDLKNALVALTVYYSENRAYPPSLETLISSGNLNLSNSSNVNYSLCDQQSAVLSSSLGDGYRLKSGSSTYSTSGESC